MNGRGFAKRDEEHKNCAMVGVGCRMLIPNSVRRRVLLLGPSPLLLSDDRLGPAILSTAI